MEAMASGLPVGAADAVALPHLVHDGENGYLFEPGNDEEMAARLTDVLTAAPEEYLRMQQASLDGVLVHDIERPLDTFEALYSGTPLPASRVHVVMFRDQHVASSARSQVYMRLPLRFLQLAGHPATVTPPRLPAPPP